MTYVGGGTENRTYNTLNQLTSLTLGSAIRVFAPGSGLWKLAEVAYMRDPVDYDFINGGNSILADWFFNRARSMLLFTAPPGADGWGARLYGRARHSPRRWGIVIAIRAAVLTRRLVVVAGIWAGPFGSLIGYSADPPRPPAVPASAHFVNRFEDGTWFDCSVDAKRNADICKAWDMDGKLIADGAFRLEDEDRAASNAELRPSLVIGNGGHAYMIYLFGDHGMFFGRILLPVDAHNRRIGLPSVTVTTREQKPKASLHRR